ncbi:unnamed protein product [Closterium sp. Yama58-4]|nr:unnamed protein product [Closterium sp. Yama58-4]
MALRRRASAPSHRPSGTPRASGGSTLRLGSRRGDATLGFALLLLAAVAAAQAAAAAGGGGRRYTIAPLRTLDESVEVFTLPERLLFAGTAVLPPMDHADDAGSGDSSSAGHGAGGDDSGGGGGDGGSEGDGSSESGREPGSSSASNQDSDTSGGGTDFIPSGSSSPSGSGSSSSETGAGAAEGDVSDEAVEQRNEQAIRRIRYPQGARQGGMLAAEGRGESAEAGGEAATAAPSSAPAPAPAPAAGADPLLEQFVQQLARAGAVAARETEVKAVVARRAAVGFRGISQYSEVNSGTAPTYNHSVVRVTPPDGGLCVGNGFILQTVNTEGGKGKLQLPKRATCSSQSILYKGKRGSHAQVNLISLVFFLHTVHRSASPPPLLPNVQSGGASNGYDRFGQTRQRGNRTVGSGVIVAASTGADPTQPWNVFFIPGSNDGNNSNPDWGAPLYYNTSKLTTLQDYPQIGTDAHGVFVAVNQFGLEESKYFGANIYYGAKLQPTCASLQFNCRAHVTNVMRTDLENPYVLPSCAAAPRIAFLSHPIPSLHLPIPPPVRSAISKEQLSRTCTAAIVRVAIPYSPALTSPSYTVYPHKVPADGSYDHSNNGTMYFGWMGVNFNGAPNETVLVPNVTIIGAFALTGTDALGSTEAVDRVVPHIAAVETPPFFLPMPVRQRPGPTPTAWRFNRREAAIDAFAAGMQAVVVQPERHTMWLAFTSAFGPALGSSSVVLARIRLRLRAEAAGEVASGEASGEVASGEASGEVASGEASGEVASGEASGEVASGEASREVASGGASGEVASGGASGEVASGEASGEVASGEASGEVASGEASGEVASGGASGEVASGEASGEVASGEASGEVASGEPSSEVVTDGSVGETEAVEAASGGWSFEAQLKGFKAVGVQGNSLLRPAMALNRRGRGILAAALAGPSFYPSAAYALVDSALRVGPVTVAAPGGAPLDDYSGYLFEERAMRYGDYHTATTDEHGNAWAVVEYVPGVPRTEWTNWATYIFKLLHPRSTRAPSVSRPMAAPAALSPAAVPLWRRMLQSSIDAHAHIPSASFVQLATVRANGTPANRSLVFRGFMEGSDNLIFYTDGRSSKVKEIEECPLIELCWYFCESWEQYRIAGSMSTVHADPPDPSLLKLRHAAWQPLTPQQRWQYCRGHPGTPWEEDSEGGAQAAGRPDGHELSLAALALLTEADAQGGSAGSKGEAQKVESDKVASVEPVKDFCLLLLEPHEVDYVHVKTPSRHRHTRRMVDEGKEGGAGGRGYKWTATRIHL